MRREDPEIKGRPVTQGAAPVTATATQDEAVLQISDLSVTYGARVVLDQINLSIRRGELVGIIGPNGAGKSTLLRAIAGLLRPDRGTIRFARAHGGTPRASRAQAQLGYVPQRIEMDPDVPLRACDVVGLGFDGHRFGLSWPNALKRQAVDRALALVEASEFGQSLVGRLSGGQLQRILIAQALVSEPSILLLDEPLSSLDLRSADAVVSIVDRVAHQSGVSVLLVTHDMNPLLRAMDRIIYVVNGRAVIGTVDEVVRPEVLKSLYGYEVDVVRVRGRILVVGDEEYGDEANRFHHHAP